MVYRVKQKEDDYIHITKFIGKRIRRLRKEANYTQKQFADECNISYRSLQTCEEGKMGNFVILFRISRGLNVSLSSLLADT